MKMELHGPECYVMIFMWVVFFLYCVLDLRFCAAVVDVPQVELGWLESLYSSNTMQDEFEGRKLLRSVCKEIAGNKRYALAATMIVNTSISLVAFLIGKFMMKPAPKAAPKQELIPCDGCDVLLTQDEVFPCGHDCPHNLCKKCHSSPEENESSPKAGSDYATALSSERVQEGSESAFSESVDLRNVLSTMERLRSERDHYKSQAESTQVRSSVSTASFSTSTTTITCAEDVRRTQLIEDQHASLTRLLARHTTLS
eukprot:TRINITY_DN11551_c0_g1_i1.p1 TRINITY_DN11551_c0_g1~~TRINITY_DN11551_c0_g1_i1.p1  ORF type:complete len:256 (+),score=40.74 TRINITY_DN11551_c0_g1_i1:65-832(+)